MPTPSQLKEEAPCRRGKRGLGKKEKEVIKENLGIARIKEPSYLLCYVSSVEIPRKDLYSFLCSYFILRVAAFVTHMIKFYSYFHLNGSDRV